MPETSPDYVDPETVRAERQQSFPEVAYDRLLEETLAELRRAWMKFGLQNRPSFAAHLPERFHDSQMGTWQSEVRNRYYDIPSEREAKAACNMRFAAETGTWADIFLEEMAEAFGGQDQDEVRTELVQVAAMALAWVATIDRVGLAGAES
jgi:hypothetical protein